MRNARHNDDVFILFLLSINKSKTQRLFIFSHYFISVSLSINQPAAAALVAMICLQLIGSSLDFPCCVINALLYNYRKGVLAQPILDLKNVKQTSTIYDKLIHFLQAKMGIKSHVKCS